MYNDLSVETKETWELLSVITEGLELKRFTAINDIYYDSIGNCMAKKIVIVKNEKLVFKHEFIVERLKNRFRRLNELI